MRQPGSSFKPIVYLAALEAGYTPSTIILDAPIAIDQGPGLPLWQPENFEKNFLGPATMRQGLQHSRNLMTIRMAQTIGMAKVAEVAERMGAVDKLQQTLAMSLGAQETTALAHGRRLCRDRQRRQEGDADLHRPRAGCAGLDRLSP